MQTHEHDRIPDEPSAAVESVPEEISKAEIELAADILLAFVKTAKGLRMYQANNPMLVKFFQQLVEQIAKHISLFNEFRFDVERFELKYKGHLIYENSDTAESLAFRMYSDGIRSFIFGEGVEEWELREFLDIVNVSASSDLDDDMVTRLWSKSLPHCSYILEEDYHEIDRQIEAGIVHTSQQEQITELYRSSLPAAAVRLKPLPPAFYTLSSEELSCLHAEVEAVEKTHPLNDIARILSVVLLGVRERELLLAFVEIYLKFAGNLFTAREAGAALKMFGFLNNLATKPGVPEEKRAVAMEALGRFWTEELLTSLGAIIDTSEDISADALKTLSFMIGRSAPGALCELMGVVEKMSMRKVVVDVTTEVVRDNPQLIKQYLNDHRWYLVRNLVSIFVRLQSTAVLDQMAALITHNDQRVRKEVLKYFQVIPDPKIKPYLLKFLRDSSATIRVMTLQYLGRAKMQFAFKPVMALVGSEEFALAEIAEKKVVYETIAELGGEPVIPSFRTMLMKKYHFNRGGEREAAVCAVAGLVKIRSNASLKVLEEALHSKTKDFRELITQAIQTFSAAKSGTGSMPGRGDNGPA